MLYIVSASIVADLTFGVRSGDSNPPTNGFSGSFSDPSGQSPSVSNARYFQYQASFSTNDTSNSPELSSATVSYSIYDPGDVTAPSAVSDLALSGATQTTIDLDWTAPGDDANSGTASTYDLRYSTSEINDGNWSSATQATGEPSPSVVGSSEFMNVTGLSASTLYYFAIKTSDEVPNESGLSNVPSLATLEEGEEPEPEPAPPTISAGPGSTPTRVEFSGQAYPGCKIEILRKSTEDIRYKQVPVESSLINPDGAFSITYQALLMGEYFFVLRAEDKDGNKTGILSFNINLLSKNQLVASDIFVPPTLSFGNGVFTEEKEIIAKGYSAPNSKIEFKIDDKIVGEATADNTGRYTFTISANGLELGEHYVKVRQIKNEKESAFSFPRAFKISTLTYPKADFNADNLVNITDWSVFLYRWGSDDQSLKSKIDIDDNGKIDIADFSIFLKAMKI